MRLHVIFVAVPLLLTGRDQAAGVLQRYTSDTLAYSVEYPASWHQQIFEGVFYIESFPASQAIRAVRIAQGHAAIKILVPSQLVPKGSKMPMTLEEWVKMGTRLQSVRDKTTFDLEDDRRKVSIVQVSTQCCAASIVQESVEWYFELQGRLFNATLVYWPGDPKEAMFMRVLKGVVLSLNVLPEKR